MTTAPPAPPSPPPPGRDRVGRATAIITAWNIVSRLTGFARVVATSAALGISHLGDTYQSANVVSNILFELLAGGLLYAVLVPTFVGLLDRGGRRAAVTLAEALLGRMLAGLAALVVLGALAGPWIMRAFTVGGADAGVRADQIRLGSFLLWFFLPQLLLYAIGAVATALLQADRHFAAAAAAPVLNNLVVMATMAVFALVTPAARVARLDLTLTQKLVLGLGTSTGVLAMTVLPLLALRRAHMTARPRWKRADDRHLDPPHLDPPHLDDGQVDPPHLDDGQVGEQGLGVLAAKGLWGAGHVGINQVLVFATLVLAHAVTGGQAAYQMAFTFFLLPHAVLANPIFTALFPRLSSHAARQSRPDFARDLSAGVRATTVLVLPAAGLLVVLALPGLTVLRGFGQLDQRGIELVAQVLAAYALGLLGYSGFFLLTRASYALDDVRAPTIVNLAVTAGAVVAMVVASRAVHGNARVAVLGLVHAAAVTAGSVVLFARLRRQVGHRVPWAAALLRASAGTAAACGAAWVVSHQVGWSGRTTAVTSVVVSLLVAAVAYGAVMVASGAPELGPVLARLKRR